MAQSIEYGEGEALEFLDAEACARLLKQGGVGCLGLPSEGAPVLRPVNFVLAGGDIIIRTGEGRILEAGRRGLSASFQFSSIEALDHTGWSVIVEGELSELPTDERTQSLPLRAWASGKKDRFISLAPMEVSGLRIPVGRGNR